jgi:AcrR family transcriptional regulator
MDETASNTVIEGVRRAIAEHGPQAVTMERIAGAMGISRMTLHRRGLSREAIIARLRDEMAREERDAQWPAMTASGSAAERLELALRALCRVTEANLDLLEALAADAWDAVYHEAGDDALTRREFTAPLRRLLEDGAADGTLDPGGDLDETATVLYNQIGWTYRHLRSGHRWRARRTEDAVVRLALNGVVR